MHLKLMSMRAVESVEERTQHDGRSAVSMISISDIAGLVLHEVKIKNKPEPFCANRHAM
jgi:hypothetical protein